MFFGIRSRKELDRAVSEGHRDIGDLREAVVELERRLAKQALVIRALLALLGEKQGLTEDELMEHVRRLASDASRPLKACPRCGRGLSARHDHCLYCGEECPPQSASELL
jgi:hypothetical protein